MNDKLPLVVLCDIDGTLAKRVTDRTPFDWDRVGEDAVNYPIADLIETINMRKDVSIVLFSGRDECCRQETEEWLARHLINYAGLYMRPAGDRRKDSVVKLEMFRNHIQNKYQVFFVLDDRDQVVEMWRINLGLTCLQVDYGNF